MEDFDEAAITKAITIVSMQRDELFHATPSLIPTAVKMQVQPSSEIETIVNLIGNIMKHSSDENTFQEAATIDFDGADRLAVALDKLSETALEVAKLGEHYTSTMQSYAKGSHDSTLDAVFEEINLDVEYIDRLAQYHSALVSIKNMAKSIKTKESKLPIADPAREKEIIDALNEIRWQR